MPVKEIVLMRGLPGSGKTTRAQELGGIICSADDYRIDETGNYFFNPFLTGECLRKCEEKCLHSILKNCNFIIIDNMNLHSFCVIPYLYLSASFGYDIRFEDIRTDLSDGELSARSVHGISASAIRNIRARANWDSIETYYYNERFS